MTCIVGLVEQGEVYIGGDSAATGENGFQTLLTSYKVFCIGIQETRMLLGCTTSCRMMQLLHYALPLPLYKEGMDVEEYLVVHFIEAVRDCFQRGGFAEREDEREEGGNFLVGFQGRLFEVQSDYQVSEPVNGYGAVGCGAPCALGALYVTTHLPAEARVAEALKAAAYHNAYVKPPFVIEKLPGR